MVITNEQVAAIRALLAGEVDLHARLFERLDRTATETGYTALIAAAFFEAVDRRFAKDGTVADVIEFVADLRSRSERLADAIDPKVAERVIWHVLGKGSIADLDAETKTSHQFLLLGGLAADANFDAAELDEFLAVARELGDRLIGGGAAEDRPHHRYQLADQVHQVDDAGGSEAVDDVGNNKLSAGVRSQAEELPG